MTDKITLTVTITGPGINNLRRHKSAQGYLEQSLQAQVWSLMRAYGKPIEQTAIHVRVKSATARNTIWQRLTKWRQGRK